MATLELAQRTERIVSAGPGLLSATTTDEFKAASTVLDQELKEAARVLAELPARGLTTEELAEIHKVFDGLTANLDAMKAAAGQRIDAAVRQASLVRDTFDAHNQFREYLDAAISGAARSYQRSATHAASER